MIEVGQIVKNIIADEPVEVIKIKTLGSMFSLDYIGVNSQKHGSKMLKKEQIDALEVLTNSGEFNFKGDPHKFKLFAEAERINSAYQFDPLFAINCSVVDPLPHQVEAVYKYLLPQPKIRFLLADDTGAGKTIMTGLLLKELIMRHTIERILIITPGGLTKQWQEDEMGVKFNIPFKLVNRAAFLSEPNIFQNSDRLVASIDFICRDDVMNVLTQTSWDLIIFDEAHKLSAYEYGERRYESRRYKAAYELSQHCEHLLLLTATPHRGRSDTFKMLMQLLDEDIFATADLASERVKELSRDGINKFFIRRLKEDMKDWNGNPLYKARFTKTIAYQLTPEESRLYNAVTDYLTKRKSEATESKNIHVSLALQVMQRRLVSSIYAIRVTLQRRYHALQSLTEELRKSPALWNMKQKFDEYNIGTVDDYDELDDSERESLDNILTDPKKVKMFTTAKSPAEIEREAAEVKELYEMANQLYSQNQEEKKYLELKELLKSQGVINGEKLVIFTEHKDTLTYLQERLSNNGYTVDVIHGGLTVDERRTAQARFMAGDAQILIATDAAGEGINLQFCRLLINWDIPWNPNRLEQRMGRIHRYGQKSDVVVFNMVASNTREGKVLQKLLMKIDMIREHLGDDRVYDVIQDVLKGVALDDIISSVLNGNESDLDKFIDQDTLAIKDMFKTAIDNQSKDLAHSTVNYESAHVLKEDSDEKRLQPIYIKKFFEEAFKFLGGTYEEVEDGIYRITSIPDIMVQRLKSDYHIFADVIESLLFCFDKHIFLDYQTKNPFSGRAHYINPGNPLFDCLIDCVRDSFHDDMLKGTVLVSAEDKEPYFAFFIKNQITDNCPTKGEDSIAGELLALVCQDNDGNFAKTSPAKLLDLVAPTEYAKQVTPPAATSEQSVMDWAFENITLPLYEDTEKRVKEDAEKRLQYLKDAFMQIIMDVQSSINELQGKALLSDAEKIQEKLINKEHRYADLVRKKEERIKKMSQMVELSPREPEVMGCAYVVPLSQMEYESHFGMSRDDEVEAIAMKIAMEYEVKNGRKPEDVSKMNLGYDVKSIAPDAEKRYIEVKGRAGDNGVMLSDNEWNRLKQLGNRAWLYIVTDCKSTPKLRCVQDPINTMEFNTLSKGVQYFLPKEQFDKKEIK